MTLVLTNKLTVDRYCQFNAISLKWMLYIDAESAFENGHQGQGAKGDFYALLYDKARDLFNLDFVIQIMETMQAGSFLANY